MSDPDELAAFVKAVLADLDAAPMLADWLQDHDREREAVLLRKRHKKWGADRAAALARAKGEKEHAEKPWNDILRTVRQMGGTGSVRVETPDYTRRIDQKFREYIGARLGTSVVGHRRWFRQYGIDHAIPDDEPASTATRALCGMLTGGWNSAVFGRRICRQCRKNLAVYTGAKAVTT